MNEAPKPDRFQFIRWTLLVLLMLVGLWLPGRGLPVVVLVMLVSALVGSLVRAGRVLPERVATHFDFGLRPDGWMGRRAYLALMAGVAVVVGGAAPQALFWPGFLAGDAHVERMALWLACLITSLLVGAHELTVRANLREPAELPRMVWALLGLFLLAIGLWVIALAWGVSERRAETTQRGFLPALKCKVRAGRSTAKQVSSGTRRAGGKRTVGHVHDEPAVAGQQWHPPGCFDACSRVGVESPASGGICHVCDAQDCDAGSGGESGRMRG